MLRKALTEKTKLADLEIMVEIMIITICMHGLGSGYWTIEVMILSRLEVFLKIVFKKEPTLRVCQWNQEMHKFSMNTQIISVLKNKRVAKKEKRPTAGI